MSPIKLIITLALSLILITSLVVPTIEGTMDPAELDVIIIDGQSNAEYSTNVARTNAGIIDLPSPTHKLMYYGTANYAEHYPGFDNAEIWEMNRNNQWMIGGLEPYLAYVYSERSGHDVLTINVARGAMSISWLAPSGEGGEYAAEVITDALNKISGYRFVNMVGWVMLQGEHDKTMAVDTYKSYFLELADYFDSIGASQCYIGATREYYGGNATIAQKELSMEYSNIHLVTEISETFTEANGMLVSGDPIHYSQKGRNVMATELANGMGITDHGNTDLLKVIPVMLLAALLLMAAGYIGLRSRD